METWKSLRISYYEPDKDGLFLEGVLPAVERLLAQGTLTRWFCQRHWMHGPHLRVSVELSSPEAEAVARAELERQARDYLARHPSTTALTEQEYLQRYTPIAVLELVKEHPLPLDPDNSVWWEEAPLLKEEYGGEEGARISRDFLADTQEAVTEVMRQTPGKMGERLFLLAQLMLAYCASFGESAVPGLSFRSHAEAYFHGVANGAQLRKRFEASFEEQREKLVRALEQAEAGPEDPVLRRWMETVRRTNERIVEAARQGTLQLPSLKEYKEQQKTGLPEGITVEMAGNALFEPSPVHKEVVKEGGIATKLLQSPEFQGRRLLVNLLYNKLQLVGVRPLERLFLCSVVAQTVEHRHGAWGKTSNELLKKANES
jgi:hypothetical protein